MSKKPVKPYRDQSRWGILNHVGSIWSPENFGTKEEAESYLEREQAKWRRNGWGDLSRHKVIPVRLTLSALPPAPESEGATTPSTTASQSGA